mmetsp:Transcript_24795/g.75526  ORF Transcript_24795/g.75526 Transcript_24795/m.75526 type:complete len:94 (+) Transcript_24795:291-572(+)
MSCLRTACAAADPSTCCDGHTTAVTVVVSSVPHAPPTASKPTSTLLHSLFRLGLPCSGSATSALSHRTGRIILVAAIRLPALVAKYRGLCANG